MQRRVRGWKHGLDAVGIREGSLQTLIDRELRTRPLNRVVRAAKHQLTGEHLVNVHPVQDGGDATVGVGQKQRHATLVQRCNKLLDGVGARGIHVCDRAHLKHQEERIRVVLQDLLHAFLKVHDVGKPQGGVQAEHSDAWDHL